MKYIIKEVLPGQIRVEFEDNSWAMVPIGENFSLEDVDDAVSYYDPEFIPDPQTLINSNVSVDLERQSTRKENSVLPNTIFEKSIQTQASTSDNVPDVDLAPITTELYGGLPLPKFHKDQIIISYVMADYFIKKNDDYRLKEELDKKIEEYVVTNSITVEDAIESLIFENDDLIVELAEEQLKNE